MKTCATCRFMAANRLSYDDDNYVAGFAVHVDPTDYDSPMSDHHSCTRIIHGNTTEYRSAHKEPAVVVDGSGYAARLLVLPTFGCVLHEEKP